MKRAGLRTRVTAAFAAAALVLTASMALVSYQLTRSSLLAERERTAVRVTYFDATVVHTGLAGPDPDVVAVLRSLDTGDIRRAVLRHDGAWYARDADTGLTDSVPEPVQRLAEQGRPAVQRVRAGGQPSLVVGVPLSPTTVFYEIHSLRELDDTLGVLALVLTAVAIMTGLGGAAAGWSVARYVLLPLRAVTETAQHIAAGNFGARLDPAAEPELARLSTSFNHMVDELSRRLERDRRFAADVSHELRSPLQTLSAAASVLSGRRSQLDERTATAAALVTGEIARFQTMVNDLLELARGDQSPSRVTVNMAELARRVCRSRGLSEDLVANDAASQAWYVDPGRMEQVIGNLLDNASAHGGGPCAVRLGRVAGTWWIEVDDEGPGVSPDDRDIIFDRFVRGRTASARGAGDGTGLGLAIVAQHVTAHGGRIVVRDRPGGGARFRVELPERSP